MLPLFLAGWSLFGGTASSADELITPASQIFFGSLSSSTAAGIVILDPFAMLQITVASKTFDVSWLLYILPALILYGLIRGRVFCGWVCPVNFLLEILDWIRKKFQKKPLPEKVLPRHTKVWVALGILVLSAIFSIPVFELFSPISAFLKIALFGSVAGSLTLIAIILVELFWGHRVWCRSLCPLGGFWELVGKVGLVNVKINHEKCIDCHKCEKACICDPEILAPAVAGEDKIVRAGDCMLCGKCIEACPTCALKLGLGRPKK